MDSRQNTYFSNQDVQSPQNNYPNSFPTMQGSESEIYLNHQNYNNVFASHLSQNDTELGQDDDTFRKPKLGKDLKSRS